MIMGLSHVGLWATDQDRALRFYTEKLGYRVNTDADMGGGARWLTISHPDQPDLEVILGKPGPPMLSPEDAEVIVKLLAKGSLGGGVMRCQDIHATYKELSEKGVEFIQEPTERPYGVEALFRDTEGNWFSLGEKE
jgi:catechol 2,3-dioxygenase-like lactoylglutathione lyase family enzyme